VAFLIVPVFGFANAGVALTGLAADVMLAPVPLGITLGLFVGKQIGVYAFVALATSLGLADMPANATRSQCYGVALLCGIGFTMSLFIGNLAFGDFPARVDETKIGVLAGSLASAVMGYMVLRLSRPRREWDAARWT
jgi:Na+:H+ antiporter, NhaA family